MTADRLQTRYRVTGFALAAITLIAASSSALVVWSTRHGIGVSPDSVTYLGVAQGLLTHHAIGMGSSDGWFAYIVSYMPGISALYAVLALFHIPVLTAARIASASLMGCNVLVAGWMVYRHGGRQIGPALLAAALIASSPHLQLVHSYALSEPLFIFLTLIGISLLSKGFGDNWRSRWFVLSGFSFAVAYMTRYAALPVIAAAALGVLLLGKADLSTRLRSLFALATFPFIAASGWMLRNHLIGGVAAGRPMAWHGVTGHWFLGGWRTIIHWVLPQPMTHGLALVALAVLIIGGAAMYCLPRRMDGSAGDHSLPSLIVLIILTYFVFLIVTQMAFDPAVQLNLRILGPMQAWLVVGLLSWRPSWPSYVSRSLAALLCVLFYLNCCASLSAAADARARGLGYNAPAFQHSHLLAAVKKLPLSRPLYSNAWDIVLFHTDRYAPIIPDLNSHHSADEGAVQTMIETMRTHRGVLIMLNDAPPRAMIPSMKALHRRLPLKVLATFPDGALYVYGKAPATTYP